MADSARYSADNLQRLQAVEAKWITRVPERLGQAQAVRAAMTPGVELCPGYLGRSLRLDYGGVAQRWLVLSSAPALARGAGSVGRQLLRQSAQEAKACVRLCRQRCACEADARAALEAFGQTLKRVELAEAGVVPVYGHGRRGKPAAGSVAGIRHYRLDGAPWVALAHQVEALYRQSSFILATNELDQTRLSDRDLLETYKAQQRVERGFRFLKDPLFQAHTLYLKSPARIMALLRVMTLCLLVYAALEYRLRQALTAQAQTFPNQAGKPIAKPTMRWVFQCFVGVHLLLLEQQAVVVLNLDERHRQVLDLLGESYRSQYSLDPAS